MKTVLQADFAGICKKDYKRPVFAGLALWTLQKQTDSGNNRRKEGNRRNGAMLRNGALQT